MSDEHKTCEPGPSTDGAPYEANGHVYQRYWCRFGDSVSIPVDQGPAPKKD